MPKRPPIAHRSSLRAAFGLTHKTDSSQPDPADFVRHLEPLAGLTALLAVSLSCCSSQPSATLRPVYDSETGKLQQLQYDSDKDGRVDTWSYMDGERVLRIEIDKDRDGTIDRWEYYGADQTLQKVGLSRANDGRVDAWAYSAADGSVGRLEISTRRDGKVSRTEFFEGGRRVRAEEDADGDGHVDKWETYRDGVLAALALDTARRGTPDRRLVYGPDGTVTVQTDPAGTSHFESDKPARRRGPRS